MISARCENCGKKFSMYPYEKKEGRRFCSHKCFSENLKSRPDTKVQKKCLVCGKDFKCSRAVDKKNWGKYCSNKCFIKSKFKQSTVYCYECGKDFTLPNFKKDTRKKHFCSQECYWSNMSRRRGPETSAWKGGLLAENLSVRGSRKYQEWKQTVFMRDDFTCKNCGALGGEINAHHIKPFSEFISEIKVILPLLSIQEAAQIYTPMWDLNNGVTLCRDCHMAVHKLGAIHGKGS